MKPLTPELEGILKTEAQTCKDAIAPEVETVKKALDKILSNLEELSAGWNPEKFTNITSGLNRIHMGMSVINENIYMQLNAKVRAVISQLK